MTEENGELVEFLEGIGDWNFDTLSLNIASDKAPLLEVGKYVFQTLGLPYHFSIKHENLNNFLKVVESRYNRNVYYHNSIHAADVLNSVVFLLHNGLSRRGRLTDVDMFAIIVSAITHDVGHPGVNNAFLVTSGDPLACRYND
jgi:cAMP-specific phosphodiesterase 4